jgi:chemotaxis protein CheD
MKKEFYVNSGQLEACQGEGILRAGAIGSCVVVTGYDPESRVGGMAHAMLPGVSRNPDLSVRTKYAENALQEMMQKMSDSGARAAGLYICLIGGGNLLGDDHDNPGPETAQSLTERLDTMGIRGRWQRRWAGRKPADCGPQLAAG